MIKNTDIVELWRPMVGYETFYSISNIGRVRREKGHNGKCKVGRILKTRLSPDGYLRLNLCADTIRSTVKIHRLVALAFLGHPPDSTLVINHIDGNKLNNRADNLEYVSNEENIQHAVLNGLLPTGKLHYSNTDYRNSRGHCIKLTEKDVRQIRKLRSTGISLKVIGEQFHISRTYLRRITNGLARTEVN